MSATAPSPEAATDAAEAATAALAESRPGTFSLDLTEEQREIRDWVHGFAEKVVRPAAAEWDEREETPWPIIKEAAQIGLYGYESLAQFWSDESGITLPIVSEELFWGDAGIGMSIMGSMLAVAGIFGAGTPEQMGEWVPQCYGTADDPKLGAFCVSEPDAGSDVSALRTHAEVRRGQGRVGPGRAEGLGHQRRHRQRARRRRVGRQGAQGPRPGGLRHPTWDQGPRDGDQAQEARDPCVPHR